MTMKVTQGHQNCCISTGHISLPVSFSILHCYWDITIFYGAPVCLWHWGVLQFWSDSGNFGFLDNTCYVSGGMGVRKVSNSKSDCQLFFSFSCFKFGGPLACFYFVECHSSLSRLLLFDISPFHVLLIVCTNIVFILHCFWDLLIFRNVLQFW